MLAHGGDVRGYVDEYGSAPLDFSANISPLGLPPGVREAVIGALAHADVYPDPLCRDLREALAAMEGVSADEVVCGNGTADILFRLGPALRPKVALLCAPTFVEYEAGLASCGCEIRRHQLDETAGFACDETFLDDITDDVDLVYLCQPNNPTGLTCPRGLIVTALERCEAHGAHLVVDECFVAFLDDPTSISVQRMVTDHSGLIVLKAFTKFFAMAGIRLGYALCSDREVVSAIQTTGQPWAVSSLAQAAGIAALSEHDYTEELRRLIPLQRAYLSDGLAEMGIDSQGEANFLFFHTDVPAFGRRMCEEGILVRDCSNYPGLSDGWYRIAVREQEANDRLLAAMREVLSGADGRRTEDGDEKGFR